MRASNVFDWEYNGFTTLNVDTAIVIPITPSLSSSYYPTTVLKPPQGGTTIAPLSRKTTQMQGNLNGMIFRGVIKLEYPSEYPSPPRQHPLSSHCFYCLQKLLFLRFLKQIKTAVLCLLFKCAPFPRAPQLETLEGKRVAVVT